MRDSEWVDLVAGARARYAGEVFDLGDLYEKMIRLGALDAGDGFPAFVDDVRARAIGSGELEEEPDGHWRFVVPPNGDEEEGDANVTDAADPQIENFDPPEDPAQAGDEEKTYAYEGVAERVDTGVWGVWDSVTQQWENVGKEQDAVRVARDRAKTQAASGVEARLRVVGVGRRVKYERVYAAGARSKPGRTARPAGTPASARPPMPGEVFDPTVPATDVTPTEGALLEVNRCDRTLVLVNVAGATEAALDPHAVEVIEAATNGQSCVVTLRCGKQLALAGTLLDVTTFINRARSGV